MKTRNRIAVALTIALSLAAGTLLLWQQPPLPEDHGLATTGIAEPPAAPSPSLLDFPAQTDITTDTRMARGDPPMPVNINRACKHGFAIERDLAGKFQGYSCISSGYEYYDTEALEALAYGDAEAASALAYRLRHTNYPRALKMAMRATALSGGKTSTLTSAAMWRPLLNREGEPDLSGYGQAYVLHRLIEKLKNSSYRAPPTYETRIQDLAEDPQAEFERLDSIVDRMFEEILLIQLNVTGNSTIGDDDDV